MNTLYCRISSLKVISDPTMPMRIRGRGGVIEWNPGGIFKFACDADITYYPFDYQTCYMSVTSWIYTTEEITLRSVRTSVSLKQYVSNGAWDLVNTSATHGEPKKLGSREFSNLIFSLTLRRRPMFHVLNTVLPVCLLAFMSLLVFKLPADSGEKVGFSLTIKLAYAVYLTLISDSIPSTSVTVSYFCKYHVHICSFQISKLLFNFNLLIKNNVFSVYVLIIFGCDVFCCFFRCAYIIYIYIYYLQLCT